MSRLVFLHGFTQTARSWDNVRRQLDRFETIALDAPGHGDNPDARLSLWQTAEQIGVRGGQATYIGYSMGARMALHVALAHPELVDRLVLISGTPGLRSEDERRQRRESDESMADRIEDIGTERFLEQWLSLPMFAGLPRESADIDDRLRNSARGLADSLRYCGTGTQEPLWDRLNELRMPVLVMCGHDDAKFASIAAEMAANIDSATLVTIPQCGHTVHLEKPHDFVVALSSWLSETDS